MYVQNRGVQMNDFSFNDSIEENGYDNGSNEKNKIGDIAIQIGYSDLYHFSKIFMTT